MSIGRAQQFVEFGLDANGDLAWREPRQSRISFTNDSKRLPLKQPVPDFIGASGQLRRLFFRDKAVQLDWSRHCQTQPIADRVREDCQRCGEDADVAPETERDRVQQKRPVVFL